MHNKSYRKIFNQIQMNTNKKNYFLKFKNNQMYFINIYKQSKYSCPEKTEKLHTKSNYTQASFL